MHCLQQLFSGRPQRHEVWERPVCVCSSMPLMGEVVGTVSPQEHYAVCCARASQALRVSPPAVCVDTPHVDAPLQEDMHVSVQEDWRVSASLEFDWASGGRYVDAPYTSSYFLQGGKYYDIEYPHRLNLAVSTPESTRFAEYKHSVPFNQYVVYPSHGADHTREGQGGMSFWPTFMTCDEPRIFGDLFDDGHKCRSMEEVWEASGISDYHRFICGYHIHGVEKSLVDEKLCPLDWYYQTCAQRFRNPDVWDHFILLDQVSPVNFWKSTTFKKIGQYEWPGHCIGGDATFFA